MSTNLISPPYQFDPTGLLAANKITNEQQVLTPANNPIYNFLVPKFAPYFYDSLKITFKNADGVTQQLNEGIDYYCTHWFIAASRACAKPIYGSISFLDLTLTGSVSLEYQTVGGIWTIDEQQIATLLSDRIHNPRVTSWDNVNNMPVTFPVIDHEWDLVDMVGMSGLVSALSDIQGAILEAGTNGLPAHLLAINPHNTTASQVGAYSIDQVNGILAGYYSKEQLVTYLNNNFFNKQQVANITDSTAASYGMGEDQAYFFRS